jgi:hypothetical protein
MTGKPVSDAVIFKTRVDMAPDGMAEMESPVTPPPSKEPGIYAFKTELPMAGRYQLSLSAKVQGEPQTVSRLSSRPPSESRGAPRERNASQLQL